MRLMPFVPFVIAFLSAAAAFADDNVTYKEGLLTIPSIDTAEQVGKYQDVVLKPSAEGTWQLLSLKETAMINTGRGLTFAPVNKVEVTTTGSFPTQVFLKLSGEFSGCGNLSQVAHQRLEGNHFDVVLNTVYPTDGEMIVCPAAIMPFAKTVPLPVYGLKAGTYSYSVNGATNSNANGLTGTFNLAADNASINDSLPSSVLVIDVTPALGNAQP